MSDLEIRPFRREDRDQLTSLVNAHVRAVVPGVSVSVNAVLSAMEREPDEYVVDPWVTTRTTLVAVRRQRVVAATHLLRYAAHVGVGENYRDAAELRWLICLPGDVDAGVAAGAAALRVAAGDRARAVQADGALPAPGCYGIPEVWPHVTEALTGLGFAPGERVETVHLADTAAFDTEARRSLLEGAAVRRSVGECGTRLSATRDGEVVGYVEVDEARDDGSRWTRTGGLADVGNLEVRAGHRRRGIATGLLAHAAAWLRLGGVERLLAHTDDEPDDVPVTALLAGTGFLPLSRTVRGWNRALR